MRSSDWSSDVCSSDLRGTGKTTVALDMAFHIACDMDWAGIPTQKGWKVIYICGEDDEGLILNTRAWMKHNNVRPDRNRFLVANDIIKLTDDVRLVARVKEKNGRASCRERVCQYG